MVPEANAPKQIYALALTDTAAFEAAAQMLEAVPAEQRNGMAYTVSQNFVIWYTAKIALRYGKKGIRVVSISPGTFSTPMGEVEGAEAASFALGVCSGAACVTSALRLGRCAPAASAAGGRLPGHHHVG